MGVGRAGGAREKVGVGGVGIKESAGNAKLLQNRPGCVLTSLQIVFNNKVCISAESTEVDA